MFYLSSYCVLCAQSCQCLWIVHSWLPHSVFSNVYTVNCKSFCFVNIHNFKRSIVFSDKTCLGQENDRAYYKCLSWELLPILNLISDFVYMYIYMYLRLLRYPTLFTCMYSTTMFLVYFTKMLRYWHICQSWSISIPSGVSISRDYISDVSKYRTQVTPVRGGVFAICLFTQ